MLDMTKISIPFFALPQMNPNYIMKWLAPSSFYKESWLLQNDLLNKNTLFT